MVLSISVSAVGTAYSAGPGAAIGLEELIELVQQRDPKLASLRRDVLRVETANARGLRPREPEIRLGYSSTSHSMVPDPYTEIREETITTSESRSGQSLETGREQGSEVRVDRAPSGAASERRNSSGSFTEQNRESGSSNSTITRTTVREVSPDRRSTSIQETVYESSRESFSESARRQASASGSETRIDTGTGDITQFSVQNPSEQASTTRGSASSQVTEQHIENRSYDRDFYEGSEDYSIQLRFYPRSPYEKRALKGRAEADTRIAEYEVETRKEEIRREVRGAFIELQLVHRELQVMDRQIDELNQEVSLQEDLYKAGQVPLDRYASSRVDAIDARLDRDAVRTSSATLLDDLGGRAGLDDPTRIDLSGEVAVSTAGLDVDRLIDTAWLNRRELGDLEQRDRRLAQDLALAEGARVPWLSLISGEYTYQERYGGKYRDEYSIVAGFNIPVFSWFRDDGALINRSREAISRDAQIFREHIELEVTHALRQMERARTELEAYADEQAAFRAQIQAALESMPDDTPAARKQRVDLGKTLVKLETRELDLTRAYTRAALRLEEALGAPLHAGAQAESAGPRKGANDEG